MLAPRRRHGSPEAEALELSLTRLGSLVCLLATHPSIFPTAAMNSPANSPPPPLPRRTWRPSAHLQVSSRRGVLATRWKLERRESAAAGGVASWSARQPTRLVGSSQPTRPGKAGGGEAAGFCVLTSDGWMDVSFPVTDVTRNVWVSVSDEVIGAARSSAGDDSGMMTSSAVQCTHKDSHVAGPGQQGQRWLLESCMPRSETRVVTD